MPRLEYFIVAENLAIDATTNQVSAFNILEEVRAPAFPSILWNVVALTLWHGTEAEVGRTFAALLRIHFPDGATNDVAGDFTLSGRRQRIAQRIVGLPLPSTGELRFEVLLDGLHVADHIIDVGQGQLGVPVAPQG